MAGSIIIKPAVQQRFDSFIQRGRVLFVSAPCGFGKSTLADALLEGRSVLRLSAGAPDFSLDALPEAWDILLIDDFQQIPEGSEEQTLCQLIRSGAVRHFVFLSRGVPPSYLTAFQYAGLMTTLEAEDLLFDREDIRKYFALSGVPITDSEISGLLKGSIGYPLGIAVTARCMSGGKSFGPEVAARVYREVFSYFEDAIYRRFDLPVRRFLLELVPFERFDLEMARMVSGTPHAGELLDWLLRHTTMLRYGDVRHLLFWPQFRAFLLWELEREYSDEKRKALFGRGALYYELKEDFAHALDCYTRGGDHAKVSELLIRNAELHPGMGHYSKMESYYTTIQDAIENAPDGSTITVIAAENLIQLPDDIYVENQTGITLDLNGHSLGGFPLNVGGLTALSKVRTGKLTVIDSSKGNGAVGVAVRNGGTLVFDPENDNTTLLQLDVYGGTVQLYGGKISRDGLRLENSVTLADLLPEEGGFAYYREGGAKLTIEQATSASCNLVVKSCDHNGTNGFDINSFTCPDCGAPAVAQTALNNVEGFPWRNFIDLQDALDADRDGSSKLRLLANVSGEYTIDGSVYTGLDLNGYSINGTVFVTGNGGKETAFSNSGNAGTVQTVVASVNANLAVSGAAATIDTLRLADGATWENIVSSPRYPGYKVYTDYPDLTKYRGTPRRTFPTSSRN